MRHFISRIVAGARSLSAGHNSGFKWATLSAGLCTGSGQGRMGFRLNLKFCRLAHKWVLRSALAANSCFSARALGLSCEG